MVVTGESRTKELGGSLLRKRSTSRKAFAVGVRARSELAGALSKGRVGSAVSRGQATTRAREYSGYAQELREGHTRPQDADAAAAEGELRDEDAMGAYLREIGTIPLLTADEEVRLAQCIERGKAAARKLELPLDSEERLVALAEVEQGEAARRRLIEGNLRLVVSVARRYAGRGLPLADLVEEGNLGLMRAAEKFDYSKGFRFSTYATWWIRQSVARGLANQARTLRLPVHVADLVTQVSRTSHRLSQELGREPTSAEIAEDLHLSPCRVREIMAASQQPISLDQPPGGVSEVPIGELVQDATVDQPSEQTLRQMLREHVRAALRELSEKERWVVSLRYGLDDERPRTLDEVGRLLGLTRERIRQIEKEALGNLRQLSYSESLHAFLAG